ncbi:MAG: hypothetical protein JWP87_2513 [Labilithrix sp.]|nr:hypothetical protein [Labilithrix sp.]
MRRIAGKSLAVAALGGAGVLASALADPAHAMRAWIAAYGFGVSTALGALLLVMIFHVTHAAWPIVLRPQLMRIVATLPLFAVLFVPIAFGLRLVYPWAHASHGWNSPGFFFGRSLVYLGAWSVLAIALARAESLYARDPTPEALLRSRRISAGGILVVAFTLTFASFDWFMSLEAGWISNMYGLYVFAGGLSSAIALLTFLTWRARRRGDLPESVGAPHFLALGRLMLMAVILWAYLAFFQLMLMWIADLPHEVSFYVARSRGSAGVMSALLFYGHFALPFVALLSRPLKERKTALAMIAAWMIVMNAVDFAWLVLPTGGDHVRLLDVSPFLVVSGLAVAFGAQRSSAPTSEAVLDRASVDPALAESLRYRTP